MTNTELLRSKINASGYKLIFIASKCGMTYQALLNKLNGKTEFRVDEMRAISDLIGLTSEENQRIFFAPKDDETSTEEVG